MRVLLLVQILSGLYLSASASAGGESMDRALDLRLRLADDGPAGALNLSPELEYIGLDLRGRPLYYQLHSLAAAQMLGADLVWPGGELGLQLDGAAFGSIGQWEGGNPLDSHESLLGRIELVDHSPQISDHATHVAGLMIADSPNPEVRGIAPAGTIQFFDWENDRQEMLNAASQGMLVSNHSYGSAVGWIYVSPDWFWHGDPEISEVEDARFGHYNAESQYIDEIVWFNPNYLPVSSAGNHRNEAGPVSNDPGHWVFVDGAWQHSTVIRQPDGGALGFDSLGPRTVVKNGLCVGACTMHVDPDSIYHALPEYYTSFGPTDDGRIKPDLVCPGTALMSPHSSGSDGYVGFSGTSASTPLASSSVLLLQQLASQTGAPLRAASIKALLIHTARELGSNPGPDYQTGWGLLDLAAAASKLNNIRETGNGLMEASLSYSELKLLKFKSVDPAARLTMCWTDLPASALALSLDNPAPRLVHDLNLMAASGEGTHYSWALDPNQPEQAAMQVGNHLDNVEQVDLQLDENSDLNAMVWHSNQLSLDQEFSLCWSGLEPIATLSPVVGSLGAALPGDTLKISLNLAHVLGFTGASVLFNWPNQALDILEVVPGGLLQYEGDLGSADWNVVSPGSVAIELGTQNPGNLNRVSEGELLSVKCVLLTAASFTVTTTGSTIQSLVEGHDLDCRSLDLDLLDSPPDLEFDLEDLQILQNR